MESNEKEVIWNDVEHVNVPAFSSYHDKDIVTMRCEWKGFMLIHEFTFLEFLRIIESLRDRTKVAEISSAWKEMNGD